MTTTTKKQWTTAYNELVANPDNYEGIGKSSFRTAAAAEQAFTELAAQLGISWSVALEGDIVLEEPTTIQTDDGPVAPEGSEAADEETLREMTELATPPATDEQGAGEKVSGRRAREADTDVIAVLVPNPKRPNSLSFARFAIYTTGITVAEFLARGGRRADLKWDADHGFIAVFPDASAMEIALSQGSEETSCDEASADA